MCYSTYQDFQFDFVCKCGNEGSFRLRYETDERSNKSNESLKLVKNRLCCPNDNSPLFTIVDKNVDSAKYLVICKECQTEYSNE